MKKNTTTAFYVYYFRAEDRSFVIGEKLCRSHDHAEKMRRKYEEKYGTEIAASFFKKVIIQNGTGKVIRGF